MLREKEKKTDADGEWLELEDAETGEVIVRQLKKPSTAYTAKILDGRGY